MNFLGASRTPVLAMASGLVVFVTMAFVTHNPVLGLIIGLGVGVGATFIIHGLFPYDSSLVGYRLDAQRRVRQLNKQLDSIERMGRKVEDKDARSHIARATQVIRRIIEKTQEKEPSSVASTAASLNAYVSSVHGVLSTYLVLQDDPDIPGSRKAMLEAQEGFRVFQGTAEARMEQALKGDLVLMRADLQQMKPLPQLTISEGE